MMLPKKRLIFILKAGVSIIVLTSIIVNVDWNGVAKILKSANYLLLCLALLLNIVERAELTIKWNLLIWARGIKVSFTNLFFINFIGAFWGLFLPSSLGTDVVRGYYLVKSNSEKSVSISSVFVDRILGIFSLMLLGIIAVFLAGDLVSKINIKFYVLFTFIAVVIVFYFFQKEKTAYLINKLISKLKLKKISEVITNLHLSVLEYKKYPKTLILSFIISVAVQITRVLTYYFIALSFNIHIPIFYFLLFIPIIMLVIMIPISIGGLGVREGTFIAFFALVGITMNDSVVVAFTNSFINTLISALGGLIFLFYNSSQNKIARKMKKSPILENKINK